MTILRSQGMKEKVVAEYILSILRSTPEIATFKTALNDLGIVFEESIAEQVFSLVYSDQNNVKTFE